MIEARWLQLHFGVVQMGDLLDADVSDRVMQVAIARGEKSKLIIEMAVHCGLNRGGAGPDALPARQRREEAEQRTTRGPK